MTKELFNITIDCLKSIPINEWKSVEHSELKWKGIILDNEGDVYVNRWQDFSWLQKREIKRCFHTIQEEIATRILQRLCNKA